MAIAGRCNSAWIFRQNERIIEKDEEEAARTFERRVVGYVAFVRLYAAGACSIRGEREPYFWNALPANGERHIFILRTAATGSDLTWYLVSLDLGLALLPGRSLILENRQQLGGSMIVRNRNDLLYFLALAIAGVALAVWILS